MDALMCACFQYFATNGYETHKNLTPEFQVMTLKNFVLGIVEALRRRADELEIWQRQQLRIVSRFSNFALPDCRLHTQDTSIQMGRQESNHAASCADIRK